MAPASLSSTAAGSSSRPSTLGTSEGAEEGEAEAEDGARSEGSESSDDTEDTEEPPELPGEAERLRDLGVYDDFEQYREGYVKWHAKRDRGRQAPRSASASPSRLSARRSSEQLAMMLGPFYNWYPNYQTWQWRRSISYWIAVTFFEGSIIFAIGSFLGNGSLGKHRRPMCPWTTFVGGVLYLICTYLMCIETINVGKKKVYWWPLAWRRAVDRLQAMKVSKWPYVASITYFLGAVIYTAPVVVELLPPQTQVPELAEMLLVTGPYIVAGLLFALGGVAECIDNEVFTHWPKSHAWVGAFLNMVGGVLFFIAGIVGIMSGYWMNALFGAGSVVYSVGSLIMIMMWKDEQFGLTFLSALNQLDKLRNGGFEDMEAEAKFSTRGLLFLLLCILIAVLTAYNFNVSLYELLNANELRAHLIKDVYFEGFTFVLIHLWIAMLSAVVRVPKMEPYHTLFIASRWWSVPLAAVSCLSFYEGVIGRFV